MKYFLECCCTSAADAVTAQRSGAARIELCTRLDIGGVTPSEDLIRQTLLSLAEAVQRPCRPIPVNVLVRPRGGDFVYSEEEIHRMYESALYRIGMIADYGLHRLEEQHEQK